MIILHRKGIWVVFGSILYFFLTLLLVTILAMNPANWCANVSSDMMYICQLAPAFLVGAFLIDETVKKESIIRTGKRKVALLFLLIQQYFFAWIFLVLWIFSIILFYKIRFGVEIQGKAYLDLLPMFVRDYLGFLLMIHLSIILEKLNIRFLSSISYIFVLVLGITEILIIPKIERFFGNKVHLLFSWIFYKNFLHSFVALIAINILLLTLLFCFFEKCDII